MPGPFKQTGEKWGQTTKADPALVQAVEGRFNASSSVPRELSIASGSLLAVVVRS